VIAQTEVIAQGNLPQWADSHFSRSLSSLPIPGDRPDDKRFRQWGGGVRSLPL